MSFLATAVIGSAVIGGAASVYGAKKGADAQQQGYDAATAENRRQYDQNRADLAPWRASGENALQMLDRASTGDMSDFYASPDYGFRRSEGMRDIGNAFSVRGGGGNAMKALNEYNSNLASGEYGAWWNRQAGRAGVGQQATNTGIYAGNQLSGQIQNNLIGAGNARASGIHGVASGVNNALQSGIGNYLYWKGAQPGG